MEQRRTLRAVVIDDEKRSRNVLIRMLEQFCTDVDVVGTADGVEAGKAAIREHRPDLVFLDVEMPPSTGFDVLKDLDQTDFQVIFVTAHDHYAVKAIRFSALDYLLKPVDIDELRVAVRKAGERRKEKSGGEQMDVLFQNLRNAHARVGLPTKGGIVFVQIPDIVRCEAESNYTHFILRNGRRLMAARTLREFEDLFKESGFVRIHQSHLVNLSHVVQYLRGDGGSVILTDGTTLDVSRRHKQDLLSRMIIP